MFTEGARRVVARGMPVGARGDTRGGALVPAVKAPCNEPLGSSRGLRAVQACLFPKARPQRCLCTGMRRLYCCVSGHML